MPVYLMVFFLIELVAVAYVDYKHKKISNLWSILNITIFVLLFFINRDFYPLNWQMFIYPFSFLGMGFVLYLLKIMGAGDAKFLASFYLLIPQIYQESAVYFLLYSTVIFGGSFFIYNIVKNYKAVVVGVRLGDLKILSGCFGTRFAFAPVILLSWIWFGIIELKLLD